MNLYLVLGVLLGVLARTLLPYLLQISGGTAKFDIVYLRSAIVSAVLGVVGGGMVLPQIDPAMPPVAALWLGITTGYAVQGMAQRGKGGKVMPWIEPHIDVSLLGGWGITTPWLVAMLIKIHVHANRCEPKWHLRCWRNPGGGRRWYLGRLPIGQFNTREIPPQ